MRRISNYKERVRRRGTHLHPMARPHPSWWYFNKELREFCTGVTPMPRPPTAREPRERWDEKRLRE